MGSLMYRLTKQFSYFMELGDNLHKIQIQDSILRSSNTLHSLTC